MVNLYSLPKLLSVDHKVEPTWASDAGRNSIFIDAKLNACLCLMARHISVPIGPDLKSLKLAQKEILHLVGEKKGLDSNNKCYDCKLRPLCRYCPGQFWLENGNEYEPIGWYCKYAEILYSKIKEQMNVD